MTCEPCTSLPELGADYLPTSSSDIPQLSLWSGMPTPAKSCANVPQTDGSPICQCGKGILDCSIHPSMPEKWIASMQDSLVRILALPGIKRALDMRHDPAFIEKSSVLLASFDPVTCFLKTCQLSLVTDSQPYSQTLPRWGSLRNGDVSKHPIAAHRITGIGGSYWPTPDTRGFVNEGSLSMLAKLCDTEAEYVAMGYRAAAGKKAKYWPTPSASDNRDRGNMATPAIARRIAKGKQVMLSMSVSEDSGQLNPPWVEWLMGFPIGFTASKDWVTPKSHSKPQPHGDCSEASK